MSILWIIFCVGIGFFANSRGRSGVGWGLLSVLISPLIAAVILACIKDLTVEADVNEVKMETERIKDRMVYNEKLTDYRLKQVEKNISTNQNYQNKFDESASRNIASSEIHSICNSCGVKNSNYAKFCESCGEKIESQIYNSDYINNEDEIKVCPYCKEKIKKEAIKCKHCMSILD